jgi:hypothetical protein
MACQICNAGRCKLGDLHVRAALGRILTFISVHMQALIALLPGHMATAGKICRHLFRDLLRPLYEHILVPLFLWPLQYFECR